MSDKKTNAVRIVEKNKVKYELLSYEVDEEHLIHLCPIAQI